MRLASDYFCDQEDGPNIDTNEIGFWADRTLPDSEFIALFTNDDERNKDLDKLTLWIIEKLEWCHNNIFERYRVCKLQGIGKFAVIRMSMALLTTSSYYRRRPKQEEGVERIHSNMTSAASLTRSA